MRCNLEARILQKLNVMLIRNLYFEQASIIAAVVCSLIVAGLLKGIIGVGMPGPSRIRSRSEARIRECNGTIGLS